MKIFIKVMKALSDPLNCHHVYTFECYQFLCLIEENLWKN